MVWKTNFDQIPYQEFLESRQQKTTPSTTSVSSNQAVLPQQKSSLTTPNGNGNANVNNNNNVIHARPNTVVNSLASSSSSQVRDQSPITIPLNESLIYQNDDSNNSNEFLQSLDPTGAALASATTAHKNINTNIHQNRPNSKKLSYVANGSNGSNGSNNSNGNLSNSSDKTGSTINSSTGSILKKLTNSSNENDINAPLPHNLTNTLEHIVQQLDILTQVKFNINC